MDKVIDQLELKRQLTYDYQAGVFRWKVSGGRKKVGEIAGNKHKTGYWRIGLLGKTYEAHRLAWLYHYGEWPSMTIDHIDGNQSNNRISNLRNVSHAENHTNMPLGANNKSGIVGVYFKAEGKWGARIKKDGKTIYLGTFSSITEAAEAREAAQSIHGFHRNHGTRIALTRKQAGANNHYT